MRRPAYLLFLISLASQLAGARWSGIRIAPADVVLAKTGDSQHFLVLARTTDGQDEDVTSRCEIISSAPDVVSIDPANGLINGRQRGQAEIRAQFDGLRSSTSVKVGDRVSEVAVRFSQDVISVLTIKGCNSSGCHGSPAGQNGFKLSLFGYDTAADHEMIVRKHNGRRVDLANPERSLLLRKPSFDIPHGGGRLI